jgi:hypothetical protein
MKIIHPLISRLLLTFPLALLSSKAVFAEPKLFPGFLFVESAYLEHSGAADEADIYLSIRNLHPDDPIVLLGISGDEDDAVAAIMYDAQNVMLQQIVVNPGETVSSIHAVLRNADLSAAEDGQLGLNILVRRGLEALPPVEASEGTGGGAFSGGIKAQEAGIPNEDDYRVSFDIRN